MALNSSKKQKQIHDCDQGSSRAMQYQVATIIDNNVSPLLSPTKTAGARLAQNVTPNPKAALRERPGLKLK